jgi:hypothetical protein
MNKIFKLYYNPGDEMTENAVLRILKKQDHINVVSLPEIEEGCGNDYIVLHSECYSRYKENCAYVIKLPEKFQNVFVSSNEEFFLLSFDKKQFKNAGNNINTNFLYNMYLEQLCSDHAGYIYVIKCHNLYKIGMTKNFKQRISTYKTECPFPFEVVMAKEVYDYIEVEKNIHNHLESKRDNREWFSLNDSDLRLIDSSTVSTSRRKEGQTRLDRGYLECDPLIEKYFQKHF